MAEGKHTVLVTGGAGYIGSHAVLALQDSGWPVVVMDNLSTGSRRLVPADVPLVVGDVGDAALVGRVLADNRIGAIMHFAGSIIVPESVSDPLKYYRNNTAASRSLVEAAVSGGVRHFIFSSTAAVYGIPAEVPIGEESPTAPINPYGLSKLMTELMLRDCAAAYDFHYTALRYFNVAGADPQGRSGQATRDATHLIKVAVEAALGKRSHVTVFGSDYATPDGTGVRDYIHVSDLARAHVDALERMVASPTENFVMNCGYGRGFSVNEVLDGVERISGVRLDRRSGPRRAGDPDALVADNARILRALPWRPRYADLDVIIGHALEWERALLATAPRSDETAA